MEKLPATSFRTSVVWRRTKMSSFGRQIWEAYKSGRLSAQKASSALSSFAFRDAEDLRLVRHFTTATVAPSQTTGMLNVIEPLATQRRTAIASALSTGG